MLRHTYVTTMLDAGADLRDVQIAARHADPRTTMRYDRARNNLDRHPRDPAKSRIEAVTCGVVTAVDGPGVSAGGPTCDKCASEWLGGDPSAAVWRLFVLTVARRWPRSADRE
jgi:hypothetical protein